MARRDQRGKAESNGAESETIEIAVLEGIDRVAREDWNALLEPDDSPFVDWDWLFAMEHSKSAARASGWSPCHLAIFRGKTLVAACPLYLKSHSMGEFVFDHGWADAAERSGIRYYPKLLAGVPFTPHTGRRFLVAPGVARAPMVAALGRGLIQLCADNKLSTVHVNFCLADEAAALASLGFLERLGYQYHWRNNGFTSFDDYLGALKSKRRYAVRHERAALVAQGVTIKVHSGEQIPDTIFGPMFDLYLSTIEKLYWGRRYLTREFFTEMRERFKHHICLVCAYRGRKLVAGTFNLQKSGVLYGRYWGCFEELKYLHFNVCYYAAIEHCIGSGIARFEPGAGGEYKWLRGFDPALTYSAHYIAHEGLRRAIANFLVRERREVQAWIAEGHERSQIKAPAPSNVEQP
ncbi:MAG TPA: GNAT family N-acetyltransferase [Candidatus Binataceae bacterium]|nr:GNAT family N-acetyltransferase [Candidatus Binataceae bacterium]